MDSAALIDKAASYLSVLCSVKPNRRTGSPGNRAATDFFASTVEPWGYVLDTTPFHCLDFESDGAFLECGDLCLDLHVSPFTIGCDVTAELVEASTIDELESADCTEKVLLMKGALCAEQLMPKNFVFYNPEHHKRIYALLEKKRPAAIVTATGRRPELVGAMYPFPLIEDGDFHIPSAYCTEIVGEEIAAKMGQAVRLVVRARRLPSSANNVVATKGSERPSKVVVTAHIDAWGSAPGALDDAAGVVVLLLLAEMLQGYDGPMGIELVALNGEDYYSAGGQMDYLRRYGDRMGRIVVAINIDDVGYIRGKSAYSMYECPESITRQARAVFGGFQGLVNGEPWYQGDHMIFVQQGIPAIAFTSERMSELMATITHTAEDTPDKVDYGKLVEVALALHNLVYAL